jgi:hypothetical protein
MSNITAIKSAPARKINTAKVPAKSAAFRRRMRRQLYAANSIGMVVITLTALSLTHLAHGIAICTGAPTWECAALAIGIDLGFISLEMSVLCASTDGVRRAIKKFANPAIIGTLVASAIMNALAFSETLHGIMMLPAIALGLAIPALIYALMRIAATLFLNYDR